MRPSRPAGLLCLFGLFTAACGGGDNGTGPNDPPALSAAEAQDAFDALLESVLLFTFSTGGASSTNIDDTRACPNGGSLRTVGTSSSDAQTARFTADVRQSHRACGAPSGTGRVWTFEGDPDVRLQVTFNTNTGASTVVLSGRVRYTSNDATGSCAVNVTLTGATSGVVTGTGTMCGRPVTTTFS
jgi:hypothetical protein